MKNPLAILSILTAMALAPFDSRGQDYKPSSTTGQVVHHSNYSLSYSEPFEQAEWVYYYLSPNRISGSQARTDDFKEDNAIATGSASLEDYKGSGYDRGHLCPAADNTHSFQAMRESFLLSNVAPQNPSFNRGGWKRLEGQFRAWADLYHGIYVVTAGVLAQDLGTIGPNAVAVPRYFYKIAYDPKEEKMIAFLLPNGSVSGDLSAFCLPVDSIENLTGIDFFSSLEDGLEHQLESLVDTDRWDFNATDRNSSSGSRAPAVQCKGIAKSTGNRCKNKTNNENGFCHYHQDQVSGRKAVSPPPTQTRTSSVQCQGSTKSGSRCRNKTLNMNRYCHLHQGQAH